MPLFRWNPEARVDHAERLEQPLAEERAEPPAGDHFDHTGRDVDADAVLKARPRLEGERQPREVVDPLRQRAAGVQELALGAHPADRRIFQKVIGEAARMGHQIADRHRPDRIDQLAVRGEHFNADEGRNVFCDRIDELEAALFVQRHQAHADDRLGHRIEAEDRAGGHRRLRFLVAPAELAGVHDDAAARDQSADAGIDAAVDASLHSRSDAPEASRAHADGFGGFDLSHVASLPDSRISL